MHELIITRDIPVTREKLYAGWTQPHLLKQWFCPKPWFVSECEIDLRVGGTLHTVFCGPDGEKFPNIGIYLEIVPNQKIVFTDAYKADWEPNPEFFFTAIVTFEGLPNGHTRYTARARHWTREAMEKHEAMGFTVGWNKALDQLIELVSQP